MNQNDYVCGNLTRQLTNNKQMIDGKLLADLLLMWKNKKESLLHNNGLITMEQSINSLEQLTIG